VQSPVGSALGKFFFTSSFAMSVLVGSGDPSQNSPGGQSAQLLSKDLAAKYPLERGPKNRPGLQGLGNLLPMGQYPP